MKPIAKPRHRGGKPALSLQNSTCNLGTVMIASALFFFLGLLRGTLTRSPVETKQAVQSEASPVLKEDRELSVQLPPKYIPYAFGESGNPEVEVIPRQLLSWKPRAYIFPSFAPAEICDKIVSLSNKTMFPSTLALRAGEKEEDQAGVRTSTGTYLSGSDDPTGSLAWVEKKMARVTAVPVSQGEPFNVLSYKNGQQYQAHMDTFDPKEFGPQGTNRIASFLLYLTDVEEGGETVFPREDGKERTRKFDECVGLKVKPKKGDALLFWSMTPDRKIDANSLHAGCPVIKGEKWVATKWIRDG